LTGADLYRISCRACHKPDGTGSPDQIRSVIGPVHAASFQWMVNDMRARGRTVDSAFIRQLTTANEADLRSRLRQGGHDMPAFAQISDQEYAVVRPYLDQLAGIPATARVAKTIAEPPDRVGELVIKGTCHICHDATSASAAQTTIASGVIPSLSSLTQTKTFAEFRQKVLAGAAVPLDGGGTLARGRMPVFDYITAPEVAAAYAYLIRYPPR
jgi:cytochrome c5